MSSEKTEKPTPKKLRDARKKGQVAKSREVASAAVLVASFGTIWAGWDFFMKHLDTLISLPITLIHQPFDEALPALMRGTFYEICVLSAMVAGPACIMAWAGNFFQVGFLFAPKAVKPEPGKLNPAKGLKNMFNMKNFIELVKSSLKIFILAGVLTAVLRGSLQDLILLPRLGLHGVQDVTGSVLGKMALATVAAFITVAAVDYWIQKKQFIKQHKMSKEEVKREYKEQEGDPLIKNQRKQIHREMAEESAPQKTRNATVVVTNPTHFAVALYYESGKVKLPKLLCKGRDHLALRMIAIAKEEGIPIMQNIPLARAIYRQTEAGTSLPRHLLEPVAQVLRWVRQQRIKEETANLTVSGRYV